MTATLARPLPTRTTARRTRPAALVLRAPGSNCDRETALALELAGARPELIHIDEATAGRRRLLDAGILVLPGGFAFGDHLGAGTLWARQLDDLRHDLDRFVASGRPVIGICNGFQALTRLGLLDGALAPNASGRFVCRWVWLRRPTNARSPLLAGIERVALPVAHGEGRFVAGPGGVAGLARRGLVGLTYCAADGGAPGPGDDPNGSDGAVAALTNETGNVLGLMPHPERCVLPGQAPAGREDGAGLAIFRNAVAMARG
jgi:phosphoribosylformylglycinamidine synthase I